MFGGRRPTPCQQHHFMKNQFKGEVVEDKSHLSLDLKGFTEHTFIQSCDDLEHGCNNLDYYIQLIEHGEK